MTYRIKDYSSVFYLSEAERAREVTWSKFPVARSSLSYRRLMATAKGRTAYCVFIGLLRMVARGKTGGACTWKGREITAEDIHQETGIPAAECAAGLELLRSDEVGWLEPETGEEPGTERFETGQEPGDDRGLNGYEPGENRDLLAARVRAQAAKSKSKSIAAASSSRERAELCSLLRGVRYKGVPVFDADAAAAISEHTHVTRMQFDWALERMNEIGAQGRDIENPAGYLRQMLTVKTPPAAWREAWQRRRLAAQAAAVGVNGTLSVGGAA